MHHVFDRWEPWAGELRTRPTGSLVADRRGTSASYALLGLQDRGTLFVESGRGGLRRDDRRREQPRRGHRRQRDQGEAADQRARRERRRPRPPLAAKRLSLEAALEFLRDDECVEITPESVRLRKVELDKIKRQKAARQGAARASRG